MIHSTKTIQSSVSEVKADQRCRVCGNTALKLVGRIPSSRTDERVTTYRCSSCGHFSLFPTLYAQIKAFDWDGVDYYLAQKEALTSLFDKRLEQLEQVYLKMFGRKPHRFLDIGCAIGLSVSVASARGLEAIGIEPEQKLAEYGVKHLGVSIERRFLDATFAPTTKFDLIFCEQVLEHIDHPDEFLDLMQHHLSDQGILYIGVPPVFPMNVAISFLKQTLHPRLQLNPMIDIFHDPDEHVSCFTGRSIRHLANRAGLKIKPLDSLTKDTSPQAMLRRMLTLGGNPGTFVLYR